MKYFINFRFMRYFILLLFSFTIYGQDSTVVSKQSVVALKQMNVVYRGIANPLSIAVNNAKSYKVYGNGVTVKDDGNYFLNPGSGLTAKVFVEITKYDDSIVIEEHEFRIENLHAPFVKIGERSCVDCILKIYKNDLITSKVSYFTPNLFFNINYPEVISFDIEFTNKRIITVEGSMFPSELINKLKTKTILKITNIKVINKYNFDYPKINGIELQVL